MFRVSNRSVAAALAVLVVFLAVASADGQANTLALSRTPATRHQLADPEPVPPPSLVRRFIIWLFSELELPHP